MLLANPYFVEDLGKDQPYLSMLLIASNCDFSCEGCQNIHLKNTVKDISIETLVVEYNENPFFQGITVGGLEIFLSGEDFLKDLIKLLNLTKTENFTIYTRFELGDIFVGKFINTIKDIKTLKNIFIKTGKYCKDRKSIKKYFDNWEISLASDNQDFIKIK